MLVWIDTETTGLDPLKNYILEIACVVTDDKLVEVARKSWVLDTARVILPSDYASFHRAALEMHAKNGLWGESIAFGLPRELVDRELHDFVQANLSVTHLDEKGRPVKPPLCGSTVSFDREFLRRHAASVLDVLHYRNIDVSSIMELAERVWPAAHKPKPAEIAHRAMPDIEQSLEMARWYARALEPIHVTAEGVREMLSAESPFIGADGKRSRELTGDSW